MLDLDLDERVATAAPTITDLSTHARSLAEVTFHQVDHTWVWHDTRLCAGHVEVTRQVISYLVRRWPSGEVLAEHPLELPASRLRTRAVWWEIPQSVIAQAGLDDAAVPGALHALEHAAIGVLPILASCDRGDLGGVSAAWHAQTGGPVIVVYDGAPGGSGFATRGAERAADWLRITHDVIAGCACAPGLPGLRAVLEVRQRQRASGQGGCRTSCALPPRALGPDRPDHAGAGRGESESSATLRGHQLGVSLRPCPTGDPADVAQPVAASGH